MTENTMTTPNPPNIVFFMVDQLSACWFEMGLDGVCDMPHFKKLMDQGTYFGNTITSNAVCCPTRATIATGLTTRGHGLLENGYALNPELPTFMRALQDDGYLTGALGKVHFKPHFEAMYPDYKQYGFDVTHITEDGRGGEWNDWVRENYPEHYDNVLATIWPLHIPEFAEHGEYKMDLRSRIKKVRDEFTWATPEFPQNTDWEYVLPFPEEVSQTNWITGHGLEFMRTAVAQNSPFFAHMSYVQPHYPFCCPAEYLQYVDESKIPEPAPAEWLEEGDKAPGYFQRQTPEDISNWKWGRKLYFADLVHLDRQLGKVMDELEQLEILDNTYVVFLSDHGDLLYEHRFWGKEERHYDPCIRVPLLIAGPGLQQGARCDDIVQHEDMCPTILDMVGAQLPPMPRMGNYLKVADEDIRMFSGASLLPYCRGERTEKIREAAYSESYNAIWSINPGDWARTIRNTQFRYTYYPCGDGEQLFDLKNDPQEQKNLAHDPQYADLKQDLKNQLMELIILQDYPKTRRELFALGVH
ncbi:MAG: sulfatase-like hydrolase/transferase [bacterium]|nr:sulfatase-like hydrolase/transferase [bacterium]